MPRMRGREAVVSALKAEDTKFIFGIPGGHSIEIMYRALEDSGIKAILTRHEQSAAFMGCCYAQATGEAGVIQGTAGPGVGNLIPGINEASSGRWPLLAICPGSGRLSFGKGLQQEIDQISYLTPITKWSIRVDLPERIPWVMKRAFDIAYAPPPGPVFVEIPIDLGSLEAEISDYVKSNRPLRTAAEEAKVKTAVDLILKADRPVIWAGGGVHQSKAWNELRELAELIAAPVLTTGAGKSAIPEDHPLAVGGVGLFGTKFSESVLSSADVIVGVGSQYEETATTGWSFWSESAKFIQIDIDPLQIGRNFVPDVALVGDAKLVLKQMFKYLKRRVASRRLEDYPRIKALMEAKRQYLESIMPEQSSSDIPIRVPRMLKEIQNAIKKESWIVIDVGVNQAWSSTWPYFHALKEGRFIGPSEYLCMGFGAAGVIGVKLAHPEDQAICITGDGGFQMVGKEMITAVQYDVPVSWFIMNNFSLGWIKWFTKEFHEEKYITVDFEEQPDFVKWAESQKCLGFHVEKPEELSQAIRNALKANQQGTPALVDVVTDPLDVPDGFSTWHHKLLRR